MNMNFLLPAKPVSATAPMAYRKDMESRKSQEIGAQDGAWIVVATIVTQLQYCEPGERRVFLEDAAAIAEDLFTPEELAYGCAIDPPRVDRKSSIARLRLIAEQIEYAGALNLALCLLDGLSNVLPTDSVNAGRVLAQRARITWKMGKVDLAKARFEHLERRARKLRNNELLVRAWAGLLGMAQLRGNYPEMMIWSRRVSRRAARCGYRRLEAIGHHGLMVASAVGGKFDEAIVHGWTAYQLREGNKFGQFQILTDISRLFLDSGHPDVAREGFVRVLANSCDINTAVPALGGYAIASAQLADAQSVRWAAAEATEIMEGTHDRYEWASALLDCAQALDALGDYPYAAVLRARASAVAQYAGFHEFVHKAGTASSLPAEVKQRDAMQAATEAVADQLFQIPGASLPDHLELVTR
jgi:hypothetical protein